MVCSCKKKTDDEKQDLELVHLLIEAQKEYDRKRRNSEQYDKTMRFDEGEKLIKQIKKEKLVHSVAEWNGNEIWCDKDGTIRIELDDFKNATYYDEEGREKYYKTPDGFKLWYEYDDWGRCIYQKHNNTFANTETFYEYVNTPKFQIIKERMPGYGEEWYYYKYEPNSSMGTKTMIYEKSENGKEYWYMRNPLMVTTMREAYSEDLDINKCYEGSFAESKKVMEILLDAEDFYNYDDSPKVFFKTKCHFTNADEETEGFFWFYNDGEKVIGQDISPYDNQYYFPIDMPSFTPIELYYHYDFWFADSEDESEIYFALVIDGWKVLDDVRFSGQKYIATDNLKLRSGQSLNAEQVGKIKQDESVTVLETGSPATIDGIESAWVKIQTEEGLEGWCFAGYLTDGTEYNSKPWNSKGV